MKLASRDFPANLKSGEFNTFRRGDKYAELEKGRLVSMTDLEGNEISKGVVMLTEVGTLEYLIGIWWRMNYHFFDDPDKDTSDGMIMYRKQEELRDHLAAAYGHDAVEDGEIYTVVQMLCVIEDD